MQIWQGESQEKECQSGCCGLSAVEDARRVARVKYSLLCNEF